ncbi:hypothetical protein OCU04_006161 [Sclerotinia nivalis]|uniref:Uncharacterized protein n=1 Tax=Sclerotinia nivalis TaxID=352851 RepID=A0A9X0AMI8_9HELO|nr:hypothetical protein OCU04_006161 [Sclerotinia nivalis]
MPSPARCRGYRELQINMTGQRCQERDSDGIVCSVHVHPPPSDPWWDPSPPPPALPGVAAHPSPGLPGVTG